MNRKLPQPGQRYRHFKDKSYQIITIAEHTETEEQMVVYQALYDDFKIYTRPLSLFMSETDTTKYPNATQQYRFEEETKEETLPDGISPKLMAFLDADTAEEKYQILSQMEDIVDNHMIDTMAVVSDVVIDDGPIDVRYHELKNCLRTKMRYETNRFR